MGGCGSWASLTLAAGGEESALAKRRGACRPSHEGVSITLHSIASIRIEQGYEYGHQDNG